MRHCILLGLLAALAAPAAVAEDESAMRRSEVVFMYTADSEVYEAYDATFLAWRGAPTEEEVDRHHKLGMRCAASIWFLTAGAQRLHEDPVLHDAVVKDFDGNPIEVPWLFDHRHEGQETWFGCTNNPDYQAHLREEVRNAMSGGADSLHIDDHLGTAQTVDHMGGCFCEHCMAGFRDFLKDEVNEETLEEAGIESLEDFDYHEFARNYADNVEEYTEVQGDIPLMDEFVRFNREAAAALTGEMREVGAEAAGHPILLSANAWIGQDRHRTVLPYLTHVVCENPHHAAAGTDDLGDAVSFYAFGEDYGIPVAATASGHDWAYAAAEERYTLVKVWVALAYAHGQRFMVPHRQWCFTEEKGTHWHTFPEEEYTPMYRFIRANAKYFDGFTAAEAAIETPDGVHATLRTLDEKAVAHLLNFDYDTEADALRPHEDARVSIPANAIPETESVELLRYDGETETADVTFDDGAASFIVPELSVWTLAVFSD